ncbi:MAG: glycine cleavage system protein H [Candidatus Binatia bacterium]
MPKVEDLYLPDDRYYDEKEHLWAKVEGGLVRVGIDELGRSAAGTISFLDFHAPGKRLVRRGAAFGSLEANKFVGALRAPVRGVIREINRRVVENPNLVNDDAYEEGWFVLLEPTHLEEDLQRLVAGETAIVEYLERRIAEYRDRGILPELRAETAERERW